MIVITTLIELFDECQIENVAAGLKYKPEKIVFVGFKNTMTRKRTEALRLFFESRIPNITIEYEVVGRYDYQSIVEKFNFIIDRNEDCYFDLTGGKELVLTAMGEVSAMRNIPMLQIDIRSGKLISINACDALPETEKSAMSISEYVTLNGGAVVNDQVEAFKWNLTEDFKKDIELIWSICKKNCALWNRQSIVFDELKKHSLTTDDLLVSVNFADMKKRKQDIYICQRIIKELIDNSLITDFVFTENTLSFRYKNEQVCRCISKAGNILELYVYMLAHEIAEESATYYNDIAIGVLADWDGVIHNDDEIETRNEIDVVLMRNLVPIFISCKNGQVHKEALYELNTIAKKFGGEYAKMVLVSTYISNDTESKDFFIQREDDMRIIRISDVDKMERDEFKKELKNKAK